MSCPYISLPPPSSSPFLASTDASLVDEKQGGGPLKGGGGGSNSSSSISGISALKFAAGEGVEPKLSKTKMLMNTLFGSRAAFLLFFLATCLYFHTIATLAATTASPRRRQTAAPVTDVVVLGDSYSDGCNAFNRGNLTLYAEYPWPTCPPAPLGRADDGTSWPEWIRLDQHQVPDDVGPPGGTPINASQWNIEVFAQSGATCDNIVFPRPAVYDVGQQILLYQTRYMKKLLPTIQTNPASTLVILFIGTNDVYLMVEGFGSVPQETDCILWRLQMMHEIGFRRFLLIQNINLDVAPFIIQAANQTQQLMISQYVEQNNNEQAALARQLPRDWNDGSTIDVFPAHELFDAMTNDKASYGFTETVKACNNCKNPDQFLWANGIHPSSRAFHIFSRKVQRFVNEGARGDDLIIGSEGI